LLYAAVGFGGGSTYNALLVLADFDFRYIPIIALSCNIVVVLGNCLRYQLHDLIPWRFSIPLIMLSVPASFIGGTIQVSEIIFMLLLGMGLITSGFLMWIKPNESEQNMVSHKYNIYTNMIISLLLGLLAGIIGIGGGIFFAPILHLQSILPSKKISAFSSIFILVNSISGLLGQFYKNFNAEIGFDFNEYSFLMIAVILGGQIGNYFGVRIFSGLIVRRLTSVLVIYVGIRLIINI
jgi:uncharacterized membrane protein YfcA